MSFRTLLLAMVVASVSTHASADPKQPTAAEKQKAAEHYDRARAAYSFGNYDDAIREYQAAFELTTAPEYMFNIAQTQRAKGDRKGALASYRHYIELDPSGAGVASARSHIEGIEAELKREDEEAASRAKAQAEAEAKRRKEAAEAAETARGGAAEVARRRIADAEVKQRRATARTFKLAGLATAGTGVAALGVSAYFGMRARSLSRDASSVTGQWTEEAQQQIDDAKSAESTVYVLLAVGSGVAVTGGILYLIGSRTGESASKVVVAPTSGGMAVGFGGRF